MARLLISVPGHRWRSVHSTPAIPVFTTQREPPQLAIHTSGRELARTLSTLCTDEWWGERGLPPGDWHALAANMLVEVTTSRVHRDYILRTHTTSRVHRVYTLCTYTTSCAHILHPVHTTLVHLQIFDGEILTPLTEGDARLRLEEGEGAAKWRERCRRDDAPPDVLAPLETGTLAGNRRVRCRMVLEPNSRFSPVLILYPICKGFLPRFYTMHNSQ